VNAYKRSNWQVTNINKSYLDDIESDLGIIVTDEKQFETADEITRIFNA
jgi:hypothetical protein